MSGGSFNYLEYRDIKDHPVYYELKNMIEWIRDHPTPPVKIPPFKYGDEYTPGFNGTSTKPNTKFIHDMTSILYLIEEAARKFELLQPVIHAIEWRASSDWDDDSMYEVLEAYGND